MENSKLLIKNQPLDTPAGAIVMACGIFINGALKNFSYIDNLGGFFAVCLLLLWLYIMSSFAATAFNKTINSIHFENPIKSFAVGTWVAATSVLGVTLYQRLPRLAFLVQLLLFVNMAFWLFYICICCKNYRSIFGKQLYDKVHGVLLLPTVSLQSIAVLGNTAYPGSFPATATRIILSVGITLYFIGFVFVIRKYFFTRTWGIEDDWQNTNCILHGAMSITGLASVVSGAISPGLVLWIWMWAVVWFVIVEIIEIYRAWRRIKKYGWAKGILVYNVTQWTRLFTFGMLYAFTMRFELSSAAGFLLGIQEFILKYGKWVIILMLILEVYIFFRNEYLSKKV